MVIVSCSGSVGGWPGVADDDGSQGGGSEAGGVGAAAARAGAAGTQLFSVHRVPAGVLLDALPGALCSSSGGGLAEGPSSQQPTATVLQPAPASGGWGLPRRAAGAGVGVVYEAASPGSSFGGFVPPAAQASRPGPTPNAEMQRRSSADASDPAPMSHRGGSADEGPYLTLTMPAERGAQPIDAARAALEPQRPDGAVRTGSGGGAAPFGWLGTIPTSLLLAGGEQLEPGGLPAEVVADMDCQLQAAWVSCGQTAGPRRLRRESLLINPTMWPPKRPLVPPHHIPGPPAPLRPGTRGKGQARLAGRHLA
jgi:hypothetical protein